LIVWTAVWATVLVGGIITGEIYSKPGWTKLAEEPGRFWTYAMVYAIMCFGGLFMLIGPFFRAVGL
jgi:hypothetical protein